MTRTGFSGIKQPTPGEGHLNILPWNYDSVGAGTWSIIVDAGQAFNFRYGHGNFDLDNLSYKVYLAKGTYTLRVMSCLTLSAGITDFDIDGVEVASWDWYGATTYNYVNSQTGIVIATSGLKTLKMRLDGKNGSSEAYGTNISLISLWRTA